MNRKYTDEMCTWLAERYPSDAPVEELCEEFEELFGLPMPKQRLMDWAHARGVRRRRVVVWDDERQAFFREIAPGHSTAEIRDAFAERFGVTLSKGEIYSEKKRLGVYSGVNPGRFTRGRESWSKGKTWDEMGITGEARERARRTQFKPGNVPHSAKGKPVGYERVTREGYVEVKVKDGRQGKANDNFRQKHRVVWEQANGRPVPPGHAVVFADHDKRNFDPDNLVLVPRRTWAVMQRLNLSYCDRETLEAAMALAELRSARAAATKRAGRA